MSKHGNINLTYKSIFSSFSTLLLLHRNATLKGFHQQKKRTELIPALANSHPSRWKHTLLHTVATRNSIFHHALYLVAPAVTVSARQQKLSAQLPQQTAWKSRSHQEPQNTELQTQVLVFFLSPSNLEFLV